MGSQNNAEALTGTASFAATLFDMDGTIIDTTSAIVEHWHRIGNEIGVPAETILETSHGRRSIDTLKLVAPHKAKWEYVKEVEAKLPELYGNLVEEIPGARKFLEAVAQCHNPWAIVTSASEPLASRWISQLSLPVPDHLVTAELVENGKPDPSCYELSLKQLGLVGRSDETLVIEDSPAGIIAAKAAGCKVLALLTTHSEDQVSAAKPDWVVKDLLSAEVVGYQNSKIVVKFHDQK
ncbi:Glycerol-1-phosphate phosphohydrolase 2 [Colletotrichum aenigma]|uniref:Glycerol-1-phosphate phosphohydrolase 2 n=1 Tax=Colletotrichum aenigma TaxID=1215731 RepID=UPI00187284AE|nr:Glycerol-1-phosphate phosphohydrolase 2 [Colletotrichum aenigma]KAF5523761.1 Glycerol-1-phosphate phosphohydrolase 2 [Colletotrichum aenigma]